MNRVLAETGLSRIEAALCLAEDGPNALPGGQRRTRLTIVRETTREPLLANFAQPAKNVNLAMFM